jgi:hypothetical protein
MNEMFHPDKTTKMTMKKSLTSIGFFALILILFAMAFSGCSENYSNGKRVGYLIKFSQKGVMFKTWEGEMNLTQSGMATNNFEFSVDADGDYSLVDSALAVALNTGKKIEVSYHQVWGFVNVFGTRGETSYFVTDVKFPTDSIK